MFKTTQENRRGNILPTSGAAALVCLLALAACQTSPPQMTQGERSDAVSRGTEFLREARYSEAYSLFNDMRPFSTRDPAALSGLAIAADMLDRQDTATRAYEVLADISQNQAAFYNNRGYSKMLRGDLQEAYVDLMRASELNPDNEKIKNNLKMLRNIMPPRRVF